MIRDWLRLRPFTLLENVLRLAAGVVLVIGLSSSIWIWRAQDRSERENAGVQVGDNEVNLSPLENRKQLRDLELYGGKGAVLMEEAKGLLQGKPLARTVAVVSVVTAAGLFVVTLRRPD